MMFSPSSMVMIVADSPEGVKGDSANNVYKAAIMETGLSMQVPLFINPGEKLIVKTEDGSYLGRAWFLSQRATKSGQ